MSIISRIFRIIIIFGLFWSMSKGIISVQEYCDKFNNYSVKPIICLLKVNSTPNPYPEEEEWESEEDEDCACDVNCFPGDDDSIELEFGQFNVSSRQLLPGNLKCQPCGKRCHVNSYLVSRCSCVAIGPSTSTSGPRCQCTVACAAAPLHSREDPFCIFNVTRITRLKGVWNPYACECDKSRAALNSQYPEFACICQPS